MAGRMVRVLGDLSVDGADVRADLDRKARTLVRLLALARGRSVPADAIAEALWAGTGPARPHDQVAVLVSRIRRALGRDVLVHGDGGYRLHEIAVDIDELDTVVTETERRLGQGHPSRAVPAARIALSLVRGPLPAPETTADWAVADHHAALRLVRRSRGAATAALLESGSWPEALEIASADLAADPFDESAARSVMRAEVAAGRPALALQTYATLRTTLADELGTDPDAETAALHQEVLRGSLVGAARRPTTAILVGRSSQLDHLDSLARRTAAGDVRVALVHGEAGIGKTTLLRSWVEARSAVGDVVLTGSCGALDRSSPLDVVLTAIAEHLRRSGEVGALLGEEAGLLGPLLGQASDSPTEPQIDPVLGPATLYAAISRVLERIASESGAVLVLDDAHLAGPALGDWLLFLRRRPLRLLVVVAARPGEGTPLPATDEIGLGPLDLADAVQLVGPERAEDLYARSGGHPLFLSELAGTTTDELPDSLVAAVRDRCDQLGDAAELVRSAAVLGGALDPDLLAAVLGLPALEVLRRIETACERDLLIEREGRYAFRHELVRSALAAGTPTARAALLNREAARVLAARSAADPVLVAEHARLGGDLALAARSLAVAADRASARFDHRTAASLLADSLALAHEPAVLLARARVRIRLGEYTGAEADALATGSADGPEVAAWAAYFDRRFTDAVEHAEDGVSTAADDPARARSLMVGARIRHARGDLAAAERGLREAAGLATGPDRLTASTWLGVLLAHRSRPDEALNLLRPATRPGVGVDHTSAALHALLFTGHAQALAGRPDAALQAFSRYDDEVERRQVPRFAGRGTNFGGWVLRNIGATGQGLEAHQAARELSGAVTSAELEVAVLEDLAEERLRAGDVDAAARHLAQARLALTGDLVFGWRLELKLRLHEARLALLRGENDEALRLALALGADARELEVPRYASVACVVAHQAGAALGEPVDLDAVARDLDEVDSSVRLEAWWWTGETGAALGNADLVDRAEVMAGRLAASSGAYADALRRDAEQRLESWRLRTR